MPDQGTTDRVRKFYRAFIIQALKDLRDPVERILVMKWTRSEQFEESCDFVEWDPEWVGSIFVRVNELDDYNRGSIISKCAQLLEKSNFS